MSALDENRKAFVSGGTGSMGRSIVEHLTSAGVKVLFSGRKRKRGEAIQTATGAKFLPDDAADRASCDRAFASAVDHLQGIDLFVSCTGLVFVAPLAYTSQAAFKDIMEVNLTSVFRYSRAAFQLMKSSGGGTIIHIVSDAALRNIHHIPVYSTAKAGLLVMSELLAAEGAPHKIRVNAICPGATVPGVQATLAGYEYHAENASTWAAAPSGRHGRPDDIAKAVMWLSSEAAAHVSGATLRVDGAAAAAMRGATRA
jgi:NAD(P)-dependent dehydrogenase (short-subunit alcohol dehydrogenase family)